MELISAFAKTRELRLHQGVLHLEFERLKTLPSDYIIQQNSGMLGDSVFIDVSSKLLPEIVLPHDTVSFEVCLPYKYPLHPPCVICTTHFLRPSLSDGRDLLTDVLGRPWDRQVWLKDLISQLPNFMVNHI